MQSTGNHDAMGKMEEAYKFCYLGPEVEEDAQNVWSNTGDNYITILQLDKRVCWGH